MATSAVFTERYGRWAVIAGASEGLGGAFAKAFAARKLNLVLLRTPGYGAALKREAPGTLDPSEVVETTRAALGHGPVVVPGAVNKLASFVMRRVLPRASAIAIMGKSVAGPE